MQAFSYFILFRYFSATSIVLLYDGSENGLFGVELSGMYNNLAKNFNSVKLVIGEISNSEEWFSMSIMRITVGPCTCLARESGWENAMVLVYYFTISSKHRPDGIARIENNL
jgi:hypothetical protein